MAPLTADIAARLRTASADGAPVAIASLQADGFPRIAHYGSVRAFDAHHLSLWVRDREAAFLDRIVVHPLVTALYRHPVDKALVHVEGVAVRNDDHGVRDVVYASCSAADQARDPGQLGVAVLIEVTRLRTGGTVWERRPASATAP